MALELKAARQKRLKRPKVGKGGGRTSSTRDAYRRGCPSEINRPNTGAPIQAEQYRKGAITKENTLEWITKAILYHGGMDTADWERHAPAVEAALT